MFLEPDVFYWNEGDLFIADRLITGVYQQAWQAAEYLGTKQRN